jgi:PAS domain S-box-containing protein
VGAATITVVVVLLGSMVLHNFRMARDSAVQRLLNVAESTAGNVERLVQSSRVAASRFTIGAEDVVRDPSRCGAWLGRTLELLPAYSNLLIVDRGGRPVCSEADSVIGVHTFADRPWFAPAMAGRFVVTDPLIGRRFPVWSVIFAAPVRPVPATESIGVVALGLDLARVQNFTTGVTLPSGAVVTVATASHVIVARSRDQEQWVGKEIPAPVMSEQFVGAAKVTEALSMEGEKTLFVSVEVPGTDWRVYAGWNEEQALGPALMDARRSAVLAAALIVVTLAGIVWVYVPTTRSLSRLVAGAEAAADHRTPLVPMGPDEIRAVALRINETLGKLAAAETEAVKLAQVTRQFADPVAIVNCDGRFEFVNPAWEAATGFTAREAQGRRAADLCLLQPESGQPFQEAWDGVLKGRSFRGRVLSRRRDGSTATEDMAIMPLRDPDGDITHVVATSRDVTESDALAERLREAEKLKAVGQLAGGIAHDFNNLLTAISGYAELLDLDLPDEDRDARGYVQEILKGSQMARQLTQQLLTFSRRDMAQERNVSLNDVIGRLVTFLRRVIPADVRVRQELDPQAGPVWIDAIHAEQIVLNLALNSRDAMPTGGELLLRTRSEPHGPDSSTGWTVLEVRDTGDGIPDGIKPRVFDPFFTTKQRGTGLGLATVHDVVTRAGGTIAIEDIPGGGTLLRVRLPRSAMDASLGVPAPANGSTRDGGRGLVLLAEDNEAVRPFFHRVLAAAGYTVFDGSDGADALKQVERMPAPPSIVVTDVMMPRMKGPTLVAELRRTWPDLPALFVSGYAEPDLDVTIPADERSERLTKPISPSDLLAAVARLLEHTRARQAAARPGVPV